MVGYHSNKDILLHNKLPWQQGTSAARKVAIATRDYYYSVNYHSNKEILRGMLP